MKLTHTTAIAILACSTAVTANAPPVSGNALETREIPQELREIFAELDTLAKKREIGDVDIPEHELSKREYKIVTDILAAINQTNLAPKILSALTSDTTFQPIVINTIVAVLKSGLINLTSLFQALDESNLVGQVIQQLISDCNFYVELFNVALREIQNLGNLVKQKISSGNAKRDALADAFRSHNDALQAKSYIDSLETANSVDKRDDLINNEIVVNLLDSLAKSGLASSVVKSLITDPNSIPFATQLIKAVIENDALPLSELMDALKNSNLVPDLLSQILTVDTFKTVAVNAFAAFAGKCSNAPSGGSGSGSGSGSGTSTTSPAPPAPGCKRRRKRRSNY